jgi:hypothetical protein
MVIIMSLTDTNGGPQVYQTKYFLINVALYLIGWQGSDYVLAFRQTFAIIILYIFKEVSKGIEIKFCCLRIEVREITLIMQIPKELVSDCCLTPIQQFLSYIMARTS